MNRADIRKWIYLLESSLALSSWLKSDSIDRRDLQKRINLLEEEIEEVRESLFQRQIRRYMKLFKKLVRREKGEGLDLVKFHQLLHIFKYVLHHGSLANCDGSRPEAVGKFLIKNPGKRTQIRLSLLTIQTAAKMVQQRNINDFAKICLRKDPYVFESKSLHKFYMFSDLDETGSDDDQSLNECSDDELSLASHEDEDIIVNGHGQDDCDSQRPRSSKKSYDLSGSVYEIYLSAIDSKLKVNWLSKVKYRNLWSRNLLRGMERKLYLDIDRTAGTLKHSKSIIGRTCLTIKQPKMKPVRYNAHPNYRSGLPWYDWVMLDWGENGIIPARLFMILETTHLETSDILYYGGEVVPQHLLDQQTSLLKPNSIYLVVQSAQKNRESHDENQFKYFSRLAYHITLEDDFSFVNASCLHGPAYVIANTPYEKEMKIESTKDFIVVKDKKEWSKYFINRNDNETFGPNRANDSE